jgi:putative membrane protein
LGVAVGALLSASAAVAQTDTSKSSMGQKPSSPLAKSDASFLKKAAAGGVEEVELGRLAAEKASDPDVKKFGQRMVDDHSKANGELMKLAQQKGVAVPSAPDAKGQQDIDRFSKLSGAAFDKAYMKEMVSDHKKDVAEFEKAARGAKDPDVKSFASSKLPTLKEHLEMAKADHARIAGNAKAARTTKTS